MSSIQNGFPAISLFPYNANNTQEIRYVTQDEIYNNRFAKEILDNEAEIQNEALRCVRELFFQENAKCIRCIEQKIPLTNVTKVTVASNRVFLFRKSEISKQVDMKKAEADIIRFSTGNFKGVFDDQLIKLATKIIDKHGADYLQLLAAYEPSIVIDFGGRKVINPMLSSIVRECISGTMAAV